jgi:hypothetical protein
VLLVDAAVLLRCPIKFLVHKFKTLIGVSVPLLHPKSDQKCFHDQALNAPAYSL